MTTGGALQKQNGQRRVLGKEITSTPTFSGDIKGEENVGQSHGCPARVNVSIAFTMAYFLFFVVDMNERIRDRLNISEIR